MSCNALSYIVQSPINAFTAILTMIQVKSGATFPIELLGAGVSFSNSEASDTAEILLLIKSVASTVTSLTPVPLNQGLGPVAKAVGGTAATGHTATVEGTDSTVLEAEFINTLAGLLWKPAPEERIIIPAATIVALKSNITITSASARAWIKFRELG